MEERGAHLSARRVPRRLMRIDVNAFLGAYPYRRVPATSPDGLLHAMTRAGIDEAWVSHLPSLFWRQPMEGNAWLYATAAREPRLKPVPALHPGLSGWEGALGEAADRAAPAGRCDPPRAGKARWARRRTAPPLSGGAIRCTMGSTRRGPRCGSLQRRAVRRTCHS